MKITITIATDNAAFQDGNKEAEIARLVQIVADRISEGGSSYARGNLQDVNGNTCGTVTVTGR